MAQPKVLADPLFWNPFECFKALFDCSSNFDYTTRTGTYDFVFHDPYPKEFYEIVDYLKVNRINFQLLQDRELFTKREYMFLRISSKAIRDFIRVYYSWKSSCSRYSDRPRPGRVSASDLLEELPF